MRIRTQKARDEDPLTDRTMPLPQDLPKSSATAARVEKYKRRHWAAYDTGGVLICICLYKKGAEEVVRRVTPTASLTGKDKEG